MPPTPSKFRPCMFVLPTVSFKLVIFYTNAMSMIILWCKPRLSWPIVRLSFPRSWVWYSLGSCSLLAFRLWDQSPPVYLSLLALRLWVQHPLEGSLLWIFAVTNSDDEDLFDPKDETPHTQPWQHWFPWKWKWRSQIQPWRYWRPWKFQTLHDYWCPWKC